MSMKIPRKMAWIPYSNIGRLVFFSLMIIFSFSCNNTDENTTSYEIFTYKNQSTYDIKIVAYLSVGAVSEIEYFIKNNKELSQEITTDLGGSSPLTSINHADSVKITFDPDGSPKIAKFVNPIYGGNEKFNILSQKNHSNYIRDDKRYSTYTFTLADYNNAE